MANKPNGVIYIGLTDEIEERVKEHKLKTRPKSFTQNITVIIWLILPNIKLAKKHF